MQDGGVSYRTYNVYIVLKYSAEICNDFRWDLKRTQVPPPKVHLRGVVGFFPTTKSGRKKKEKKSAPESGLCPRKKLSTGTAGGGHDATGRQA